LGVVRLLLLGGVGAGAAGVDWAAPGSTQPFSASAKLGQSKERASPIKALGLCAKLIFLLFTSIYGPPRNKVDDLFLFNPN
jgi:hypothetical protein